MKVHQDLRNVFQDQQKINRELQTRVEDIVLRIKSKSWHFEARLKSEESFAVKVEAGLVGDPRVLEDFLAGVLVVPNFSDIGIAETQLLAEFSLVARRPSSSSATTRSSTDFAFDDLRLYLKIAKDDSLPPRSSDEVPFEIQVRTFLQHAWSVATHDVVYKTDHVSWGRERIANQVKAMLEHAEIAVESIGALENSGSMPKHYKRYDEINALIEIIRLNWAEEELPKDLKRLATAVLDTAGAVATLDALQIGELLHVGKARYRGAHNLDWSPYRTVLQYMAEQFPDRFKTFLRARGVHRKVYVYRETLDQLSISPRAARNAVVLSTV